MEYRSILYEKTDRVARITINRPAQYNACTRETIHELIDAFTRADMDGEIGVVVLTGAGEKAFCAGGDLRSWKQELASRADQTSWNLEVGWQHLTQSIRTTPKPVVARLNGYAIGGGHVLHVACDLSIAAEHAQFGQAGPRIGSFDPGFGTGDLMRAVGVKRAKEIWFLCKRYTAREALQMGLVNSVVPYERLDEAVDQWSAELLERSPTALKMLKYAFLAETDGTSGITQLGIGALSLFFESNEAMEGKRAFDEGRKPDFARFRS